jgi:hypothetical protein
VIASSWLYHSRRTPQLIGGPQSQQYGSAVFMLILFFDVLGFELGTSHLLSRCSITSAIPSALDLWF